jgi:hypothetical protein
VLERAPGGLDRPPDVGGRRFLEGADEIVGGGRVAVLELAA